MVEELDESKENIKEIVLKRLADAVDTPYHTITILDVEVLHNHLRIIYQFVRNTPIECKYFHLFIYYNLIKLTFLTFFFLIYLVFFDKLVGFDPKEVFVRNPELISAFEECILEIRKNEKNG